MTAKSKSKLECAHCKRALTSRFEITQYNTAGSPKLNVNVCSLICLVQWAYRYAAYQGQRGIDAVKNAFAQIQNALKGSNGQ